MKTKFPITEKFKTISPANVSSDRYRYMKIGEEEPNLGIPVDNGYFLTSTPAGVRSWVAATPAPSPGVDQQIIFNNNGILSGTSDLYYNPTTKRLGIGTANSTAKLDISETWDSSTTDFVAFRENITDTASSANSKLIDLRVNDVSKFNVTKEGIATAGGFVGNLTGNASTATALASTVSITLNGEVSGTVEFNGTATATITTQPEIIVFNKFLSLTGGWIDVGISGTDLATGTYILQLFANDITAGGTNNSEYHSGIVSWYSGTTASTVNMPADEIVLHRAGASSETNIYLRTYRSTSPSITKLQIQSLSANSNSASYQFKFRKFI